MKGGLLVTDLSDCLHAYGIMQVGSDHTLVAQVAATVSGVGFAEYDLFYFHKFVDFMLCAKRRQERNQNLN